MKRCLLVAQKASPDWPSLSVASLKACAEGDPRLRGRVEFRILDLCPQGPEQVVEAVLREKPDILGVSCYLWSSGPLLAALPALRRALPDALIVLGGPEVYAHGPKHLESRPEVDAVATGEGERTFADLLDAWLGGRSWREVLGLAFREGGRVVETPQAAGLADLDALPSPYLGGALEFTGACLTMETSRGCPFDCAYCDWPGRGQKPREFSLKRVMAEFEHVLRHAPGVHTIFVADADPFVNRPRAKELLRRLRLLLEGTRITVGFQAYLPRLDDELLRLLDTPNLLVAAGVQTVTPEALSVNDRFFHREPIATAVRRLRELAPAHRTYLHLISGLPGDSLDGYRESLDWCLSLEPRQVKVFPAVLLPGSRLGQEPALYDVDYDPAPPRLIRSSARFPAADMARADTLTRRINVLQFIPISHRVLSLLARVPGGPERPFLETFEGYGRLLELEGVLPSVEGAENEGEGVRLLWDPDRLRAFVELLRRYAAKQLAARGREDLFPMFDLMLRAEEARMAWRDHVRSGAPELRALVDEDFRGARRAVWLGSEALDQEVPLIHSASCAVELAHHQSQDWSPYPCQTPVFHFRDPGSLAPWLERAAAGADLLVLSHLYSGLEPARRSELLALLRRSAPDAALVLWEPRLENAGDEPMPTLELAAAGWDLTGAPAEVARSRRLRFRRVAASVVE